MLAIDPSRVRDQWRGLERITINARRWPGLLLGSAGKALRAAGARELGADLYHVGMMLSWVTSKRPSTYIGEPRAACPANGDAMLDAHADEAVAEIERALSGEPPYFRPLGWSLRFLERSR
jgi:hypothetical protein